ncbi:hypothetical protein V490_01562 [Pseudogymnoascus sp. VKM F-3557]|nr:hypothetical protein V490_01562 [Pseudogymnoascus sp. VKM F-3557]
MRFSLSTFSPAMEGPNCNVFLDVPCLSVDVGTEDIGQNDSDKEAAAKVLHRSLQEAFKSESELPDTISEFQTTEIDRIGHLHFVLSNIKQHLRKVLALSCLSHVRLDYLLKLLKLCESCLNSAQIIEFKFEDKQGREHQAMMSGCGLLSGYICLLIRSGGRQEIQPCSGDFFQAVTDALRNVLETSIIPTVVSANQVQSFAATEPFATLISACEQILEFLATLGGVIKLPETVLDTLESSALLLILADTGAKTRLKELRTAALDLLVQLFHYYPSQRPSIVHEILISLKKTKASESSRDVKLVNGGSIQVLSALIMRIIQSAASKYDDSHFSEGSTSSTSELALKVDRPKVLRTEVRQASLKSTKNGKPTSSPALFALVLPLLERAKNTATQIIGFVIGRAISSEKTRDESFRNLLCILVGDFARSVDCPEWPASELLLRLTLFKMIQLLEADKTPSTVKLMAVDVLGLIGAAISRLNLDIRQTAKSGDFKTSLSWYPKNISDETLQLKPQLENITFLGGPFHASVQFLILQSTLEPQIHGAVGYLTTQWAFSTCDSTGVDTDPKDNTPEHSLLVAKLQKMIVEKAYEPKEFGPHCVSASSARLAYGLILLRSKFCESFSRVLETLLDSAKSLHAPTRCNSLKALLQILEADPSLIDRTPGVMDLISGRTNDNSALVRESSLRLISRCKLGVKMLPDVLRCITDESIAIRRRAMNILEDIYLHNPEANAKSEITETLLSQIAKALVLLTSDPNPTIQKLALKIIRKVWISPHTPASTKKISSKTTLAMTSHLCLMAEIVQGGCRLPSILTTALRVICLHPSGGSAVIRVYSLFVATMFDMIDKPTTRGNTPMDAAATFQLLLIFAKINANIFTGQQILLLQPYIKNIGTRDDIIIYRFVISILHCALPLVSDVDPEFLRSTSRVIIKQIPLFKRAILDIVIPCLWAIGEKLEDNELLTNLAFSCVEHARSMVDVRFQDPINQKAVRKVTKVLLLASICGRHCHFQPERIQMKFTDCHSFSKFMIGAFLPFSFSGQPMDLREAALDAICRICQVQPEYFTSSAITTLFEQAFEERNSRLETVILHAFKEFLMAEEQHPEVSSRVAAKLDHIGDSDSQIDGVALFITQKYMSHRKDLRRIALATQGDQALLAIEVISSMTRQGLLPPKECAHICIALGTSQNVKIAAVSIRMHRALHDKFGSIIEKEYLEAVDVTRMYQRGVVGNLRGATRDPYLSILHLMMEVTKTCRIKGRKFLFEGLCARLEPNLSQGSGIDLEQYLQRSRFILDNMAYFRYASVEELNAAIAAMKTVFARAGIIIVDTIEDVFAKAGIAVDTIETELLGQTTPLEESGTLNMDRLRTLAVFSTVLSGIWDAETYLCQQYGLSGGCTSTTNETSKNLNKAPKKVNDIDGRAFWERNSMVTTLDSEQAMLTVCRAFISLFHKGIDSKVAALSAGYLPKGVPRSTGAGGGKLKGRKRKAPPK